MTSAAIGWFSASTKAFVAGTGDDRGDENERDYGSIWEAWVIDVEIVSEGRRGVAEESESRVSSSRRGGFAVGPMGWALLHSASGHRVCSGNRRPRTALSPPLTRSPVHRAPEPAQ